MLRTIELYFLLFFTYSVLGWIMEVTKTLIDKKKFVNRGFLIGPYCPIYGYGAILITLLLRKIQDRSHNTICNDNSVMWNARIFN